jgi:succinoglycan biosynthesis transport protein ExoP
MFLDSPQSRLPARTEPRPGYPERQYPGLAQPAEVDQGSLFEYWRLIRRRKGSVILIAFTGAVLGFLFTLPQTPIYQAYTSVEIVGLNDSFLNMKQVNPVAQDAGTTETSDIQTQIKILQSQTLIARVLNKLKKPEKFSPAPSRLAAWRKALNLPEPKQDDAFAASINYATNSLKVRAAGQTRILEITVDSTSPQAAAAFANTLANEFIDENLESRWKATERTTEWLTRQLDDVRIKLERSEDKLQEYARSAGLLFTQEKTNVDEDKLRQVQQSLSAAQADRIAKQSRYETAATSTPESLPDILSDAGLREYGSKLTELRRQIAELGSTYTPDHPKVQRVQAQIATIQAAFDKDRSAILKRIKNDYEEALRKEKLLSDDYAQQTRLVTGEGEKAIQYNILKREVDSNRSVYDAMLQQLNQASIASALRASNVRVVDPARVPGSPYKPDTRRSTALGLLGGLFLGVAFVIIRERADRTIQQPGDANFYLNLPELGIIPSGVTVQRPRVKPVAGQLISKPAPPVKVELVTWQDKQSMLAESFRSTLVSILFSGENGSRPRTIVLTSPNPSEGKSTTVCNLGIAIAEVGNRVLLIDADLRRPRLHGIFGLTPAPGLSDMLRDRTPATSAAATESIRATPIPNLFVLVSGEPTAAAMTLLYGNQMPELLKQLRQQFDTILIDTPPMLQISDARVLGRMSDRVILVIRAGKTTRDATQAACQRFQEDGTTVMGTILNDWNPKNGRNGYYGYYNGYYRGYNGYYGRQNADSSEPTPITPPKRQS